MFFILFIIILFTSCQNNPIPKKKGYLRITLPVADYVENKEDLPFSFWQNKTTHLVIKKEKNALYPTIYYPFFNAELYLTYHILKEKTDLDFWGEYARKMVYQHSEMASHIEEKTIKKDNKYGIFYTLKGEVASNFQFYISDSNRHFLRGSFYFSTPPNQDSLTPFIHYIEKDLHFFLENLQWKQKK